MDIVQQVGLILEKVGIRKTQVQYLVMLMGLWLAIPGRVNFLNLERYGDLSERSHRAWFEKPLDFVGINQGVVESCSLKGEKQWVLGIDASFVSKSGKATPNLGKYWDSKQNKAVRGLEVSCCSLIELSWGQAFGLDMRSTQPSETTSRMEQYVGHLHDVLGCLAPDLRQRIGYVAADGHYSKQGFIEAVRQQDKHLVGKLRCDANLKYLFSGLRSTGPGRPKRYDGKIDFQDWSRWEPVQQEGIAPQAPEKQSVHMYSIVAYAPNFKINLRVVAIVTQQPNQPPKHQLFFSTDLTQDPQQILQIYAARFQMEFLFRDTKQHLGLQDCQSRQPRSIEFHYNMALSTLNFAKLQQLSAHQGTPDTFTFSIEDAKRRAYNQLFASRILSILPLIPNCDKYLKPLQELLNLGVKAA